MKTINYGMGAEYLPKWGMKEALREIYQNFLDYGDYESHIIHENDELIHVCLRNNYVPQNLEFLRIGNSGKRETEAVGKHGEGLKMAMLIFAREDCKIEIITDQYRLTPGFINNSECGDLFCINYGPAEHEEPVQEFVISFMIDPTTYKEFVDDIITEDDIIFQNNYGAIVDKPKGNIYSGGLFVANVKNLAKAYDIKPRFLDLDRDRATPKTFDVHYYASRINESQGEFTFEDLECNDLSYIHSLPEKMLEEITPTIVGNEIEYMREGVVIKNTTVIDVVKSTSYFSEQIAKLKMALIKGLGLYDMLVDFQKKHVHSTEAQQDFELILNHVKNNKDE